ncbi:MAG TPA: aspartate aminotransferase family protein [Candidatus Acidoferrales bacterium]|jgi:predicted acetylornithine/succinylornithine family transaminase|nr:aspartate aminotransferase family protein [Candidatus Acidoferrales bacterium]
MTTKKIAKKKTALRGSKGLSPTQILADEARYLMKTYRRPPVVFTRGRGCRVYDAEGREYLDFLGGIAVNALGHAHPQLVRVIRREAGRATHISNLFHNAYQGPLAHKLANWAGLDRVFFTNSGAESIEGALKLARGYAHAKAAEQGTKPKTRFLAMENSFHGRTFGALSVTYTAKYREPFEPLVPGVEFVRLNDVADLDAKFDDTVCAVLIEPIQGEGGIYEVSEAFWERARELTLDHDAALIADEIQSGLGRTGRKFAYQRFESLPDIVTVAKPLAGGLPLGAFIANDRFASAFHPGLHGTTFGGGPLVCATALEFLTVVEEDDLLDNVRARGAEIRAGLEKLASRFDFIRELRGEGLIQGIDLSVEGASFVTEALESGLLINCTHDHILRLLPPFILRSRDVAEFLRKFEAVLARAAKSAKPWPASAPAAEAHAEPVAVAATR